MQIFMNGRGEKDFAPDQIIASVTFNYHADTYDEALKGGVEKVKNYIDGIAETTDFKPEDFKTKAYSVQERFHTNRLDPKTEADLGKNLQKRISDGFFFTQFACLEFDYDKMRLAKLLATSSKNPDAPMLHIDFTLKDVESKKRELIAVAYDDAKKKAEALATAANKNLRDCVRVEIDSVPHNGMRGDAMFVKAAKFRGAPATDDFEQQIKNIDETFKPDDITLSKEISCVWETSN
jgi:uncharacterized protein YggE